MFKRFGVLLLLIAGCSQGPGHPAPTRVETYTIDEATMIDFYKRSGRIDAQLEPRTPPAAALKAIAEDDQRLAVIVWSPEKVLKSLGLRNSDRIAMIDGDNVADLFEETWASIGKYKNAGAFGTHKYTDFANRLFILRGKANAAQLLVYRPKDDAAKNPFAIRIEFTD
jgi:hypothetical protein